jgi:Membrane protein involved in the export of O-antigen and teichoic acid
MGVVIRQSIKGTLSTYMGTLITFVTVLYIVPKFIGDELYGLIRVILEAGILFATIFQLGSASSIMRFFPHFKSGDKKNNGFFFYMMAWTTFGVVLFIPVFFLLKQPITDYFSKSPLFINYLYWLIPLTLFFLYWQTFEVYANVLMRIAVPKFVREVLVKILTIFVFLAYAFGYIGQNGLITGLVCIYGIAMLVIFFYVSRIGTVSLKHNPSFITPALKKDFLSYTSIIALGTLGSSLIGKIDVFMISGEMGLSWTGIYSIAFYMIAIIEIPSRAISSITSPIAVEALKNKDFQKANDLYKSVSLHQLLIGSAIFLLLWINIDNIYSIIPNGEVYSAGKWVVLFLGIVKLIETTIGFGGILISFSKYYHWHLYFLIFISAVTIFLNWLLIPRLGISGAAISTVGACLVSSPLQQWIVLVKLKANPYSWGTLKVIGVIALLLCFNYFLPSFESSYFDMLFRTFIISITGVILIYRLRISQQTNELLLSVITKIGRIIKKK